MIVAGNLKSFIGASHFLPEEMELQRRRILSPNSHIGRERSVCISALTESSEHLQAPARSKGMWPGVSSHQYWKTRSTLIPTPVSFGDVVSISRNEVSVFLLVGVSWVLFLMLNNIFGENSFWLVY